MATATRHLRRRPLLAFVAIVVLAGSLFALLSRSEGAPAMLELPEREAAEAAPEAPVSARIEPAVAPDSAVRTVRDFLADFYGSDWEARRAQLEAALGKRLDEPFDDHPVPAWEEVEARLRDVAVPSAKAIEATAELAVEWEEGCDSSWDEIRRRFSNVPEGMRDVELLEFQALAKAANEPIREIALQRATALASAIANRWDRGQFDRAPYVLAEPTPAAANRSDAARVLCSGEGWAVRVSVTSQDLPAEYDAMKRDLDKRLYDRTVALARYLDGKRP